MVPSIQPLAPLLAHWRERPQRTWSVVITVFGDSVVPRGGTFWLVALLELLGALGIDAGAVRTALSRLVADGWMERERIGRNSAYRLAERGRGPFAGAADRIYAAAPPPWDGRFSLVVQPQDRAAVEAAGYGQVLPGLFAAPAAKLPPDEVMAMHAVLPAAAAQAMAARAWPLDRLANAFHRFIEAFAALPNWSDPAPLEAAAARTLLIHEYRRIVLHAPSLPTEISPPGWPAQEARALCAAAYAALLPASEAWLDAQGLPAAQGIEHRFGACVTKFL